MIWWKTSLISRDDSSDIRIVGLGAVTAIGHTALSCAAAVRAGVSGFANHQFMVDSAGRPITVSQCPWLADEPDVAARICDCLCVAIEESLGALGEAITSSDSPVIKLLVALPSDRPGLPDSLHETVRHSLQGAFGGSVSGIRVEKVGHAGGILALDAAMQLLVREHRTVCVVAGADSYCIPDTLEWLEDTEQLHGAGARNNAWGFVPGEGAGAVLLASAEFVENRRLSVYGRIAATGIANEAKRNRTDTVCIGEGLTTAFRAALEGRRRDSMITDIYCDMNGVPYRADEFAFTAVRVREHFATLSDYITPADCWGDVGAASAPLFAVLACYAWQKGYANGPTALIWASSDTGERGATVIER